MSQESGSAETAVSKATAVRKLLGIPERDLELDSDLSPAAKQHAERTDFLLDAIFALTGLSRPMDADEISFRFTDLQTSTPNLDIAFDGRYNVSLND